MSNWRYQKYNLDRGLAQNWSDQAMQPEDPYGLSMGSNLDFSLKGAVRGRNGWQRKAGYQSRVWGDLASGTAAPSYTTVTDYANTGYANNFATMFTDKNSLSERPGLVAEGRIYVHDGTLWTDRLGAGPTQVNRYSGFARVAQLNGGIAFDFTVFPAFGGAYQLGAASYDFSLVEGPTGLYRYQGVNTDGTKVDLGPTAPTSSVKGSVPGVGARCGTTTAILYTAGANLILATRVNGALSVTETVIAANNAGIQACVCCDQNQTVFFVVSWITGGGNQVTIRRVSTAGAVLTTNTITGPYGTGIKNVWVTNTDVATNKVMFAVTDSISLNITGTVCNATTLADLGITTALPLPVGSNMTNGGQVVCGAANSSLYYVAFQATPLLGGVTLAPAIIVAQFSSTANAFQIVWSTSPSRLDNWAFAPGAGAQVFRPLLLHQPVRLVTGQVILGLTYIKGWTGTKTSPAATWVALDLRDTYHQSLLTGLSVASSANSGSVFGHSGNLLSPVCVSRSDTDEVLPSWGPCGAIVATDALSYRFSASRIDTPQLIRNFAGGALEAAVCLGGISGTCCITEVKLQKPQTANYKESTIIGGRVPRILSRGAAVPVGFPYGESPALTASGAGGADVYSLQAIWEWIDDAGQIHRSAPSNAVFCSGAGGIPNITFTVSLPQASEKELGFVYTKVFITEVNSGSATHYLAKNGNFPNGVSIPYSMIPIVQLPVYSTLTTPAPINTLTDASQEVLYTDGNVLSCQTPSADGGVATIGSRCWMSDGNRLFASRLGDEQGNNEAPSWHIDDTLALNLPGSAGRVVSLQQLTIDKVAVLCEHGVWVTEGDGPDDTGLGSSFLDPKKVSDIGCALPRMSCFTPKGVVYQAKFISADGRPSTGGLQLLDGSLGTSLISGPTDVDMIANTDQNELAYLPEREQLLWIRNNVHDILDIRAKTWVNWTSPQVVPASVTAAQGVWWCFTGLSCICCMALAPGLDDLGTLGAFNYTMSLTLGNLPINEDPGGWGRCRSVQIIYDFGAFSSGTPHDLTVSVQDSETNDLAGAFFGSVNKNVECFLDVQKCDAIAVTLSALPATATWTGMILTCKGTLRSKQGIRGHS